MSEPLLIQMPDLLDRATVEKALRVLGLVPWQVTSVSIDLAAPGGDVVTVVAKGNGHRVERTYPVVACPQFKGVRVVPEAPPGMDASE